MAFRRQAFMLGYMDKEAGMAKEILKDSLKTFLYTQAGAGLGGLAGIGIGQLAHPEATPAYATGGAASGWILGYILKAKMDQRRGRKKRDELRAKKKRTAQDNRNLEVLEDLNKEAKDLTTKRPPGAVSSIPLNKRYSRPLSSGNSSRPIPLNKDTSHYLTGDKNRKKVRNATLNSNSGFKPNPKIQEKLRKQKQMRNKEGMYKQAVLTALMAAQQVKNQENNIPSTMKNVNTTLDTYRGVGENADKIALQLQKLLKRGEGVATSALIGGGTGLATGIGASALNDYLRGKDIDEKKAILMGLAGIGAGTAGGVYLNSLNKESMDKVAITVKGKELQGIEKQLSRLNEQLAGHKSTSQNVAKVTEALQKAIQRGSGATSNALIGGGLGLAGGIGASALNDYLHNEEVDEKQALLMGLAGAGAGAAGGVYLNSKKPQGLKAEQVARRAE
jgi:hypothetical protein